MDHYQSLLARNAPLGRLWSAMHKKKINREELNTLNIAEICQEILDIQDPIPARLSAILLKGIATVHQKKVDLLYADYGKFLAGIEKGLKESKAKKAPVNVGDKEHTTRGKIKQIGVSLTKRVQPTSLLSFTLDAVDVPVIDRHQAAPGSITLIDSCQTNVELHNRFERFDIEGDDGTQLNDEFPSVVIPSPRDDPKRPDTTEDKDPAPQIIQNISDRETLEVVDVSVSGNGGGEEEVPMIDRHQASPESITLIDSNQTNAEPHNGIERFGIEGDDGTQLNDEFPSLVIPSPPSRDDPKRADITKDKNPAPQIIHQDYENINAREEPQRQGPANRKRGRPTKIDREQQIRRSTYRLWRTETADIKRARMEVGHGIEGTTNLDNIMGRPAHVLWFESYESLSARVMQNHPLERSSTSPPGVDDNDFADYNYDFAEYSFEEPDGNVDNQLDATAKERTQIDDNGLRVPESTLQASSSTVPKSTLQASSSTVPESTLQASSSTVPESTLQASSSTVPESTLQASSSTVPESTLQASSTTVPESTLQASSTTVPESTLQASSSTVPEHGHFSQLDLDRERKRVQSSSGNSSGGLPTVPRFSDIDPTPDQEHLMETGNTNLLAVLRLSGSDIDPTSDEEFMEIGPLQNTNQLVQSFHPRLQEYINASGVTEPKSLDDLAKGMIKKEAARLFKQICVAANYGILRVEQEKDYGPIFISKQSQI